MNYIGIDLGTTNSIISGYDGENLIIFKNAEQEEITPTAIYIDKNGNKYFGSRAYNAAIRNPDNAALLFKRFIGTKKKIGIASIGAIFTPEECSAEILKTLYNYLPDEIRQSNLGTIITVPAAFNQMQKDATMVAAKLAGIGKVTLMQEPVAAVMSVMRNSNNEDGIFLVYDLGGGTLDIAIAENISGQVNLLSHGGIAMCGGRDFDRAMFEQLVKPWLLNNFKLPEDISINPGYKILTRMAIWACEKAKIELSKKQSVIINLPETELNLKDLNGEEIYIDIPISRDDYNKIISDKINDSIIAIKESLNKAGLKASDIGKIVFIGGPTQYEPLRQVISDSLGIKATTEVDPMTAVSQGAALFAESIDWSSKNRVRKKSKSSISVENLNLTFNYMSRTPLSKARVVAKVSDDKLKGCEFEIINVDTGWVSGRMELKNDAAVELTLSKAGKNHFKVKIYNQFGSLINFANDAITISKTAASVDAIPASSSIGIEAKDKIGGKVMLEYLVKEGDKLPIRGRKIFKAEHSIKAQSTESIKFKLWEGDIVEPIEDNRFIGTFEIKGSDFDSGVIPAAAELILDYEMLDSGNIILEVSVPSIGNSFNSGRNFYSKDSALIDYSKALQELNADSSKLMNRFEQIEEKIEDARIAACKDKIVKISKISQTFADDETIKKAMDDIGEVKKILALIRQDNLKVVRQIELDNIINMFENIISEYLNDFQRTKFGSLKQSTQRAIDNNLNDFEFYVDEIKKLNFDVLWSQDWFIIDGFEHFKENSYLFKDQNEYNHLIRLGDNALREDDIHKLKQITIQMHQLQMNSSVADDILSASNIIKGR